MNPNIFRRHVLRTLVAAAGFALFSPGIQAEPVDRDLFGEPEHKLVYQLNKADLAYMEAILFSVGEMLRKYDDNIHLVVTVIGPGIHILAKQPQRPVPDIIRQRVASLAAYGVSFHACGNTMKSLHWDKDDMLDFAEIVDIGADDLMQLQQEGYSYISW
jgi:intracellular sulfur oxidation DsrE/DsrF family protein